MEFSDCYRVGGRVRDLDGFKATIRYIGPVASAKNKTDTWLGVEWDDKLRGKHDGSCVDADGNLHRYFECVNGAGSFLKPTKLAPYLKLQQALKERYVQEDAPSVIQEDNTVPNAFVTTSKGNQLSIEFVGEQKLRYKLLHNHCNNHFKRTPQTNDELSIK